MTDIAIISSSHSCEEQANCSQLVSEPKKKSVRFSNVTVREYPIILGDNPSVTVGPPVTIDWQPFSEELLDLESHMLMTPLPHRTNEQMSMPSMYRREILLNAGCSCCDMMKAMDGTNFIKEQRLATIKSLKLSILEEIKEKMKRRLNKIFSERRKVHIQAMTHFPTKRRSICAKVA